MVAKPVRKVVCAPDSFKETLSATRAAAAMGSGVVRAAPTIRCDQCPVADGGEGSLEILTASLGGSLHWADITGPLGERRQARYGLAGQVGVVELAEASGIALVNPGRRDPTRTTTYGTGELMAAAVESGCREIIVCVGGSATVDGGAGIIQALGGRFFDHRDDLIETPLTGGRLHEIARISAPPSVPKIRVAYDVSNPLLGPRGAAAVYGPQKGATDRQVVQLEAALRHLATVVRAPADREGYGAAGGAGYTLKALCGATMEPGIDLVLDMVGFEKRCADALLVLTGEGRLDEQSRHGKACVGVARVAGRLGVPTIAIAGDAALTEHELFAQVVSLTERYGRKRAMTETAELLEEASVDVIRKNLREGFSATTF